MSHLVAFLVPLTAIFLGWLILDEQLRIEHFAGMAIYWPRIGRHRRPTLDETKNVQITSET